MPYANVNAERLYYEIEGKGPPLVLIRGLSRSMRYWGAAQKELEKEFTVLAYDHRGMGRSAINGRGFLLPDLARDLAELIAHVGWEKANVFGLSLGGMVAQHLALDHPHRVDKLALASTWAGGKAAVFPSIKSLAILAVGGALPPKVAVRVQAPRLMSPGFVKANKHVPDEWVPYLIEEPPAKHVIFRQALSGALHDATARLPSMKAPTLVVGGSADRLISVENCRHLATLIPNARLEIFDGVGHEVMSEAPDRTSALLREFFLETARESSEQGAA